MTSNTILLDIKRNRKGRQYEKNQNERLEKSTQSETEFLRDGINRRL